MAFLRKKGKYWYGIIKDNGKPIERSLKTSNKHEADKRLARWVVEREQSLYKDIRKTTFKQLAKQWLDSKNHDGLKPKTIDSYEERLRAHILPFFENMVVSAITPTKVEEFKTDLADTVSARTVNYDLFVLRAILDKGIHWGFLRQNPVEFVSKLKQRKKEFTGLTREEVTRLLNSTGGQDKTLLMTAVLTGLRLGELLAMKWENLDFKTGAYIVKESFGEFGFDVPKTASSVRSIIFPQPVLEELRKHKIRQNELRLKMGEEYKDNGLVFTTTIGTPIDRGNLRRDMFYPALNKAGLSERHIRFHDLRGTAATLALEAGANVCSVQNLLGHKTAKLTLEVYAKVTKDSKRDLADKLGNYFSLAQEGV